MSGALLILFVAGAAVAVTLGLRFLFRRDEAPAIPPTSAEPDDRRAGPGQAGAEALAPLDDKGPARPVTLAASMSALPDVSEVLDDSRFADAGEPVSVDRSATSGPPQDEELASSDDGSDASDDALVPDAGAAPEVVETLDDSSPVDAEAMRDAESHAKAPAAATEEPCTQAGTMAPDPRLMPPNADTPATVASLDIAEHSESKMDESAETDLGTSPNGQTSDAELVPEADRDTALAGEFPAEDGDDGEPVSHEVSTDGLLPKLGAKVAASDTAAVVADESEAPESAKESDPEAVREVRPKPFRPARHRDRRGQRRTAQSQPRSRPKPNDEAVAAVLHPPAEAKLRLMLHPVRRTVNLAAVLARPVGYPDHITLLLGAETELGAYGEDRYDDVDLEWTPDLLTGEVRLNCQEGYQWVRSGRRVQLFAERADEPGLISVGSASPGSPSAIICRKDDEAAVRSMAAACGSPELVSYDHWAGVPEGWVVMSGYHPKHAAAYALEPSFTVLDPGIGAVIRFSGGLEIRSGSFAQGSPPRIEIDPLPVGSDVTINGARAEMDKDGCWRAENWDAPGDHLVDVVPGPSLTYRIIADPWLEGGWNHWNAHPGRFSQSNGAPWANVEICGASLLGPSGEHVVAAEAMDTVTVLGLRRGVTVLQRRPDAPIAVGLLREAPAFLVSSSGPRRTQGHIDWLAPLQRSRPFRVIDPRWVAIVRSTSSRRLSIRGASEAGRRAWRRAREHARRYRKVRG